MIDSIGNCFICGLPISISEVTSLGIDAEIVYDEDGNPIHQICALAAIRELEKRAAIMKEPDPVIKFEVDGLDSELEKIMFNLIEKIQIQAHEEGFDYLLAYDENKFDFQDVVLSWAYDYGPDECYLCGRFFACRPQYWAFDANGNIVHEICYKGGVDQNDET